MTKKITPEYLAAMVQQEFAAIHGKIDDVKTDVGLLSTDMSGLRTEVREVRTGQDAILAELSQLNTNVGRTLTLWERCFSDLRGWVEGEVRTLKTAIPGK